MSDLGPNKKRIAQLFRMLGATGGERRNAFAALERSMRDGGVTWTDIGDALERGGDETKYTEFEMQEFAQAARAEGVEVGIEIGKAHTNGGGGNGHLTLPSPAEMADFCQARCARLKDDRQREFIADMVVVTRRPRFLSPARLGYLVSLYIQNGGKT